MLKLFVSFFLLVTATAIPNSQAAVAIKKIPPVRGILLDQTATAKPSARAEVLVDSTVDSLFSHLFVADITRQLSLATEKNENEFRVTIDNFRVTPEVPENISSYQIHVLGLGSQGARRLDGLFSVVVIAEKADQTQEYRATGVMKVIGPVVVAANQLQRGQRLGETDLAWKTMAWSTLPTGAAGISQKVLIGQRVKSLIQEGDPIYSATLEEPLAVSNGDAVEVTVFSGPGVIIKSRAVARQNGRVGDIIRIEQPDTKKMLLGSVSGKKAIEVRL